MTGPSEMKVGFSAVVWLVEATMSRATPGRADVDVGPPTVALNFTHTTWCVKAKDSSQWGGSVGAYQNSFFPMMYMCMEVVCMT